MEIFVKFLKNFLIYISIVVIISFILNNPEPVGLSDNGDFNRVLVQNGIVSKDVENSKYYFQREYFMNIKGDTSGEQFLSLFQQEAVQDYNYSSSQTIFIQISKALNYLSNAINHTDLNQYNIDFLNIQYTLILAFALTLLLKAFQNEKFYINIINYLIVLIVFLDLGYLLYFNSFYGEALQYASFMALISILIYNVSRYRSLRRIYFNNYILYILFYIFLLIFGTSKSINLPIAALFGTIGTIICILTAKGLFKWFSIISCIFAITISVINFTKVPQWMSNDTTFNAIFYGVLKDSDTPTEDLFYLGINSKYISLANTNAYNGDYKYNIHSNAFKEKVFDNVTKFSVLQYYLLHPNRLIQKVAISLENAQIIQPIYLGNYQNIDNHIKLETADRFSYWSNFRVHIHIMQFTLFILVVMLCLGYVIYGFYDYFSRLDNDPLHILLIFTTPILNSLIYLGLTLSLLISLVLPVIANGEADLQKHMFLFNNIYDLILVLAPISILFHFSDILQLLKKSKKARIIILTIFGTFLTFLILLSTYKSVSLVKEIEFGSYNNEKLKWQVLKVDEKKNEMLIISKKSIGTKEFDVNNSNYWIDSSLRKYLNNEFYKNVFSDEEKRQVITKEQPLLLATYHSHVKKSGVLPYYWNAFPVIQDKDISRYYQTKQYDKVFLLNSFDYYDYIVKNNIDAKTNMAFLTPYANNTSMIRYVGKFGYIYINEANIKYEVYPCMWIKMN